jgi:hypothetical protein
MRFHCLFPRDIVGCGDVEGGWCWGTREQQDGDLTVIIVSFPRPLASSQRSDEKDTENQLEAVQYQRF